MYFKTYAPATLSQNCETARAFHTYYAVRNFCGKDEPRATDYYDYLVCKKVRGGANLLGLAHGHELLGNIEHAMELRAQVDEAVAALNAREWADIKKAIRNAGQPLRKQFVVYFAIINGGVKKGQTCDLVQRYSNINRETPIEKLWYLPVESEEASLLAEEILGDFFDHARAMKRCRGKDDYYQCDEEAAQRFITANAGKIYQTIMEAIEGI